MSLWDPDCCSLFSHNLPERPPSSFNLCPSFTKIFRWLRRDRWDGNLSLVDLSVDEKFHHILDLWEIYLMGCYVLLHTGVARLHFIFVLIRFLIWIDLLPPYYICPWCHQVGQPHYVCTLSQFLIRLNIIPATFQFSVTSSRYAPDFETVSKDMFPPKYLARSFFSVVYVS